MTELSVKKYLNSLKDVKQTHPYGKELLVFEINEQMFAVLEAHKQPVRLSLRCDSQLAKLLIDRYEEVMPGHKLNRDKWITVVSSGQLNDNEIKDLINHSYQLVKYEMS